MAFGMNFFRRYQGRFLLGLGVLLMFGWFILGPVAQLTRPEPGAGTIFGSKVPTNTYEQAVVQLETIRGGQRPSDEDVWRFLVLQHEADRLGIRVNDEEIKRGLRQWVMALTGAKDEGMIDDAYKMVLGRLRKRDEWVRYAIAGQMRVGKLLDLVAGALPVTDAQAWQSFVQTSVNLKLKALKVPVESFKAQVAKPDDATLASYYELNKPRYLVPPMATVEYLYALKSDFEKLFTVSEEEIAEYYEQRKLEDYLSTESMVTSESVSSTDSAVAAEEPASSDSRVAVSTDSGATAGDSAAGTDEIPVRPLAEVAGEIRMKLLDQKARGAMIDAQVDSIQQKDSSLKEIADRYGLPWASVGPATQEDRGTFGELADAKIGEQTSLLESVFSKAPSDLLFAESPAGYFLCKRVAMEEEHQPELPAVKDKVETDYVQEKAREMAKEEAARALEDIKVNGWDAYLNNPKYEVSDMTLGPTGRLPEVFKAAVTLKQGEFGGPVEGEGGMNVFSVLDRSEPTLDEFERMKPFVRLYGFLREKQELVKAWEDDLYKQADVRKTKPEEAAAQQPLPEDGY